MLKSISAVQNAIVIELFILCCVVKVASLEELVFSHSRRRSDFAAAAIRFLKVLKVPKVVGLVRFLPDAGHPSSKNRLANANEGDLIGPFAVGDMHVLLKLDTRITTRLDEELQAQLLQELYNAWLDRQLQALEVGDSIEPPEYIPAL